ncbi:MAG: DUF4956 domain-containing protein [Planctomycetota bacterium]|nr:MAG: DUF4956 domain-containing protein [Planctomycetota bacterium]
MPDLLDRLAESWKGPLSLTPTDFLVSLACAVACGLVVSEVYRRTHKGIDYSRPFVTVLILVTVIVSFVTLIVGDDLARAFTLVGALSVVRFRTAVKEPRDLAFIFWAVGVGMGAGCRFVSLTVFFTVSVSALVFLIAALGYGSREPGVKVLRLRIDSQRDHEKELAPCFAEFLRDRRRVSVSLVRQGLLYELVYFVRLKPRKNEQDFLAALRKVTGDEPVSLTGRDQEADY